MISSIKKDDCFGCGACSQACPKKCIKMAEDKEGFLYPSIDHSFCVGCGLCDQSCPVTGHNITTSETEKRIVSANNNQTRHSGVYVAYSENMDIRMASSSGGAFSSLAQCVLNKKGVVFGAAFDKDWSVHHIEVTSDENLERIRESKYLQSRIDNTYQRAKYYLDMGRVVLFSGTGCQIAGLKGYLGKEYDNLVTIDVLCHGVPSPKVWNAYIKEKEQSFGASINNIHFRNKKKGWKKYSLFLGFENGKQYYRFFAKDPYMILFLDNLSLRPSCYNCKFKTVFSKADLSLGDCWGIKKWKPELDDDKGISVVLVHTEKGEALLGEVKNNLLMQTVELEKVWQPMLSKSVKKNPKRSAFFNRFLEGESIEKLSRISKKPFIVRLYKKINNLMKNYIVFAE